MIHVYHRGVHCFGGFYGTQGSTPEPRGAAVITRHFTRLWFSCWFWDSHTHTCNRVCGGTERLQGFTKLLKAHTKQAAAEMPPHSDINIVPHKKPSAIKSELEFGPVSQSQNFISFSVFFFFFFWWYPGKLCIVVRGGRRAYKKHPAMVIAAVQLTMRISVQTFILFSWFL